MKDVGGGALSFCALSAELLFNLGATVGGFVLATEIDSLLLCPGTPSNVSEEGFLATPPFAFPSAVAARGRVGFEGVFCPILSEAALVIRGAIAGGAVEATGIVSARL